MLNIAIDGPSGAGKSTVARRLAETLNVVYLDTGAMYRAVALAAHRNGLKAIESDALNALLQTVRLDIKYIDGIQHIYVNGEDVSTDIRANEVSSLASAFSALQSVRVKLVELQREIAAKTDTVLDGRDIGSTVLPGADYKFYLDASVDVRAKRRYDELRARGNDCNLNDIRRDIEARDYQDMHRTFSPLVRAKDAVVIDSSDMTVDAVVKTMTEVIEKK